MQIILAIIALVIIVWLGYFAVGLLGQFGILALDTMARGFGVNNPVLGWVLVGLVFGAAAGLRYGLRRAGAPLSTGRSVLLIAVPVLILGALGATRASPGARFRETRTAGAITTGTRTPAATDGQAVTITVDGMNLRSRPTTQSAVVATLHPNSPLTLIETSGEWSHITDRSASPRFTGWLKSKYLHSLNNSGIVDESIDMGAPQTGSGDPADVARVPVTTSTDATSDSGAILTNDCYHAEGIACTVVPEQSQGSIQDAFNASLEAINQRDMAQAQASVVRANQLLNPWSQRSPNDPWVARTRRHLDTISGDIRTVCNAASKKGEQLPGCSPQ